MEEGEAIIDALLVNADSPQDDVIEGKPSCFTIVKSFPSRGDLQQYRLATAKEFSCARCQKIKTSQLVAIKNGRWNEI